MKRYITNACLYFESVVWHKIMALGLLETLRNKRHLRELPDRPETFYLLKYLVCLKLVNQDNFYFRLAFPLGELHESLARIHGRTPPVFREDTMHQMNCLLQDYILGIMNKRIPHEPVAYPEDIKAIGSGQTGYISRLTGWEPDALCQSVERAAKRGISLVGGDFFLSNRQSGPKTLLVLSVANLALGLGAYGTVRQYFSRAGGVLKKTTLSLPFGYRVFSLRPAAD